MHFQDVSQTHNDKKYFQYEILHVASLLLTAAFTFTTEITLPNYKQQRPGSPVQIAWFYYHHNFILGIFDSFILFILIQKSLEKMPSTFNSIFLSPNCMLNFLMPDSK